MKGIFDQYNGVPEDIVYTPDRAAREVVRRFNPTGKILEPCRGGGVFMKYLPKNTEWCEIREGRDFFEWKKPVDWIVTNPPYLIFSKFLTHAFTIAPNIVFLVPPIKVFNGLVIMRKIWEWGGIPTCYVMGDGSDFSFPQEGYPIAAMHFQKDYRGGMQVEFYKGRV